MNVKKEAEQLSSRINKGMSGIFALVVVFLGFFFIGIPAILYLAGMLPLFVLGIMAGMFLFMALATLFALRAGNVKM
jgi:hypothetical protein